MVKVMAAMGALNAAATPAAPPTGKSRRTLRGESANHLPSAVESAAHMCTVGPSRPSDAPAPTWTDVMKNLATPSRSRMRNHRDPWTGWSAHMDVVLVDRTGRTMEAEAAIILTAITQGHAQEPDAVMSLYASARRVVSKEALAPPTQVDFCPDRY